MSYAFKSTHVQEAKRRLIEQLKGHLRTEGLIAANASRAQTVEDVAWQLFEGRWLAKAEGAQLDGIGELIGEPRNGKSDQAYMLYMRARILVNVSSGTGDQLLEVLAMVTGAENLSYHEYYPAAQVLTVHDRLDVDIAAVADILRQTRAAGVDTQIIYSPQEDVETFAFAPAGAVDETASATQGWADAEQTTGGRLAGVVRT
jgi:hypothetical protein